MRKSPVTVTLTVDPAEMARRGRIGAYRLHATHDSTELTARARAAFLSRFEREVDHDGTLPVNERRRRAEAAKRAYFTRLAYRSAKARRQRAKRTRAARPSIAAPDEEMSDDTAASA